MKIAIFEYITGGGLRSVELPPSLAREGDAMIQALVRDLAERSDLELVVLRDDRLPPLPLAHNLPVAPRPGYGAEWKHALDICDAAWPIAPESDGLLEGLCADVEHAGKALLNSSAETVRLAGSKMATVKILNAQGIPTVPTCRIADTPRDLPFPRVVKPDDGVGCEGAHVLWNPREWEALPYSAEALVQPYLEGTALSLSALFDHGRSRLLSCNRLWVDESQGQLELIGCEVNALPDHGGQWQALADAVAHAMPGLWGYAGIDFLMTADVPLVLEVNPRLTTTYAGIRRATGENPAALVIDLLKTGQLPEQRRPGGRSIALSLREPLHEH